MNQAVAEFIPSILEDKKNSDKARFDFIVSQLGIPYARGESYAIYNANSLDLLKKIPKNSIDLTFTSPPYNIGKAYENIMPTEAYVNWCAEWIELIRTATTDNGALMLNIGYVAIEGIAKNIPISYLIWNQINFFLQQEIVWNYGAGVAAKKFLSPRNEKLLWYVKNEKEYTFNLDDIRDPDVAYPNQKRKGKLRCNTIGKNPSDVWQIAKVTSGEGRSSKERTPHPAQFPLDLCERVIKGFSPATGIVLDPFLGSGSTIDACSQWGRFSIGFEIKKDYCEIAAERAESRQRQTEIDI